MTIFPSLVLLLLTRAAANPAGKACLANTFATMDYCTLQSEYTALKDKCDDVANFESVLVATGEGTTVYLSKVSGASLADVTSHVDAKLFSAQGYSFAYSYTMAGLTMAVASDDELMAAILLARRKGDVLTLDAVITTGNPTSVPTESPTSVPTESPTSVPTKGPTHPPSVAPPPTAAAQPDVTLCENSDGSGKCCTETTGTYDFPYIGSNGCPGNDRLSYIQVDQGCSVTVSQHYLPPGNAGTVWTFGPGTYTGGTDFNNDDVSSFSVDCRGRVTLCDNSDGTGKCCDETTGTYDFPYITGNGCPGNDRLSYIRVDQGCSVTVTQHHITGNTGSVWNFGPGTYTGGADFSNDVVSSFSVNCSGGGRRRMLPLPETIPGLEEGIMQDS